MPDNNYGGFLQQANLVQKQRGDIVDLHGHVLGQHDGIAFYTIGQRKGLGITTPRPVYVVELDAENNRVVVGDDSALDRDEFIADRCNWHPFDKLTGPIEVTAKIRYNHPGTAATIAPLENNRVKVKLHTPQRAITPGQAAVFLSRRIWWSAAGGSQGSGLRFGRSEAIEEGSSRGRSRPHRSSKNRLCLKKKREAGHYSGLPNEN